MKIKETWHHAYATLKLYFLILTPAHFCNTIYYKMQTERSIINISVPKALEKEIILLARQENKTISELLREAFNSFKLMRNWSRIRRLGQLTAETFNLESYAEIEKLAG